jgi:hypothetical protein
MVKGAEFRDTVRGRAYHERTFPHSIAVQYMQRTSTNLNVSVLFDIVRARVHSLSLPSCHLPQPRELLVHVRLGDVFNYGPRSVSVDTFLADFTPGPNGYHYVMPRRYYEDIIAQLRGKRRGAHPSAASVVNVTTVTLFAGYHNGRSSDRMSEEYLARVRALFVAHGFSTCVRLHCHPDDDVVYSAHAHYFLPSGGGFSRMIGRMVETNGGTVLVANMSVPKRVWPLPKHIFVDEDRRTDSTDSRSERNHSSSSSSHNDTNRPLSLRPLPHPVASVLPVSVSSAVQSGAEEATVPTAPVSAASGAPSPRVESPHGALSTAQGPAPLVRAVPPTPLHPHLLQFPDLLLPLLLLLPLVLCLTACVRWVRRRCALCRLPVPPSPSSSDPDTLATIRLLHSAGDEERQHRDNDDDDEDDRQ